MADAPATYAIVIAVLMLVGCLLFIMKDKYTKLRSRHTQLIEDKEGLDVSTWHDIVHEHKYQ